MVKREILKRNGFSDDQINKIDAYCTAKDEAGQFDNTAVRIILDGSPRVVCGTVAEAIRQVLGRSEV